MHQITEDIDGWRIVHIGENSIKADHIDGTVFSGSITAFRQIYRVPVARKLKLELTETVQGDEVK